jgi:hypothetical protein
MELIELHRLLRDTEVDHVVEAGQLVTLVKDVSMVLEDLGMSPIPGTRARPAMSWQWWTSSWSV